MNVMHIQKNMMFRTNNNENKAVGKINSAIFLPFISLYHQGKKQVRYFTSLVLISSLPCTEKKSINK